MAIHMNNCSLIISLLSVVILLSLLPTGWTQDDDDDPEPENPCNGINCGRGKYCAVIRRANSRSNGKSYECRARRSSRPTVPVCYDKVEIRVPAGGSSSPQGSQAFGHTACRNECFNDNSCGGGDRICCMQGCDRICYTPDNIVIDYTG